MSGTEVNKKIIKNLQIIEQEAKSGLFVLSKRAQAALDDNYRLRCICPHEFDETGHCIFCDKEAD